MFCQSVCFIILQKFHFIPGSKRYSSRFDICLVVYGFGDMKIERKEWMSILAKATAADVDARWSVLANHPEYTFLRAPEIGGVMVRGRMGATGDAFNLGEMTVTRCSVQLVTDEVGHGYVQGRDRLHAERAAVVDALLQGPRHQEVLDQIVTPLAQLQAQRKNEKLRKAAATKVDFFTLVRGED